jgi:CheY-like chemotaxis protein
MRSYQGREIVELHVFTYSSNDFSPLILSLDDLEVVCPDDARPQLPNIQKNSSLKDHFDESHRRRLMLTKNILVVDDDEVNLLVETSYIKKFGFKNVVIARNGLEAINHIKEAAERGEFFHIVFMDCNMPVMDGYQASKEIKEMMNIGIIENLTIVAVTANVAVSDCERCLKSGMDHFLTKPIKPDDIEKMLFL